MLRSVDRSLNAAGKVDQAAEMMIARGKIRTQLSPSLDPTRPNSRWERPVAEGNYVGTILHRKVVVDLPLYRFCGSSIAGQIRDRSQKAVPELDCGTFPITVRTFATEIVGQFSADERAVPARAEEYEGLLAMG
jgi:hypothetical protein